MDNSITKPNQELASTDSMSRELTLEFAQHLIDSKTLPQHIKTPEQMLVVMQKGRELGLPPLASAANLPFINGIPSPTVHLFMGLARNAGSVFTIVDDYKEIFEPLFDPKTGEPLLTDDGKPQVKRDRITTIKVSKFINGRWFDSDKSYRLSQAAMAGYLEKDNWKKMPQLMLFARACTLAARFAEPGATMGLLTDDEMLDINNVKHNQNVVLDAKYVEEVM